MPTPTQGTSLSLLTDFILATREAPLGSPDELVSQASKYRTNMFRRMIKGLAAEKMIQGGSEIVDYVQLSYTNSNTDHNIDDTFNFTGTNSLKKLSVPWRLFTCDSGTINEFEIDLNQGSLETVFKRVRNAKLSELELSFWEGGEEKLWRAPYFEAMEKSTLASGLKGQNLSIPSFVTDDGGMPTSTNSSLNSSSSDFTTLMGVDTGNAAYAQFKNQYFTFDNTNDATRRAESGGVIAAMDKAFVKVQFESPSGDEKYVESTKLQKMVIACNTSSHTLLTSIARSSNNVLTPSGDVGWANGKVVYHGLPVDFVDYLDNVYYDTTVGNAADGAGKRGFRWLFLNMKHFYPIFNSKHFRKRRTLDGGASNPFSTVILEDTLWNLWCANRREQAMVRAA